MKPFDNIKDCEELISICKKRRIPIDPDWYEQLEALKKADSLATTSTPIYNHLVSKTDPRNGSPWYSDDLQNCIKETVDNLLTPKEGYKHHDPGLLLGKIQSGKTRAFVGIIGLMFDKGVDIAIVLTKGTKALAQQTKTRMDDEFAAFAHRRIPGQVVIGIYDILNIRSGLSTRELKNKNIIICKKEKNNLDLLNTIAHLNGFDQKKILIVDDEADFASRNYKKTNGQTDLAALSYLIDSLVSSLDHCYYLQVTATPYSLYLQPDGCLTLSGRGTTMPFKPRFTTLLPTYPGYIGGKQYFVDAKNVNSMYNNLYRNVTEQCRDAISRFDIRYIKNVTHSPKLCELRQAIMGYFVATAIRRIQEKKNVREYLSSCIVHVDIAKDKHNWEGQLIENLTKAWEDAILDNNNKLPSDLDTMVKELYLDYEDSFNKGHQEGIIQSSVVIPPLAEVCDEIVDLFEQKDYRTEVINSDKDVPALLDKDGQLKLTHAVNIFVGGQILDRGITISNLLCFFYGRNPKTLQQDTVLQHSRMYGNRSKEDMAVTRFYTTYRLHSLLSQINDLDDQLRQWLISYSKTPNFDQSMAVVFSGNSSIRPCSNGKIAMSSCLALRPGSRFVHAGFQTDCQTKIKPIIDEIDQTILSHPNYKHRDSDNIFEIETNIVINLLEKVRSTYIYSRDIDNNQGLDWNVKEFTGAIAYATTKTNGKMWIMYKTDRNMSRIRTNGDFVDAPDDGRNDLAPARAKAVNMPIIIFIKENGSKQHGWRDAPFFWPVLVLQKNIASAIYTSSQNAM